MKTRLTVQVCRNTLGDIEMRKPKEMKQQRQDDQQKALESLHWWLAKIQARALRDLLRGKRDV